MKLLHTLKNAQSQQKSVSICWIDLANAYGSVSHPLILRALQHYHAPPQYQQIVKNFYTGPTAMIATEDWCTPTFPISIGIFQGDPLSVIIFNTVINIFIEFMQNNYLHLGYSFTSSNHSCVVCPIQVGSRGYIDTDSFSPLISFLKLQLRQYTSFLTSIASISLTESYGIWKSRNNVIIN